MCERELIEANKSITKNDSFFSVYVNKFESERELPKTDRTYLVVVEGGDRRVDGDHLINMKS